MNLDIGSRVRVIGPEKDEYYLPSDVFEIVQIRVTANGLEYSANGFPWFPERSLKPVDEQVGGPAMSLTKEQLAALKRVAAYMDEMYSVASPYHGCTEDSDLLRAMIDSSEHVTDHTKMIGFDLEKARAADEALPYPLDANEIWVSSGKGQMHINPPNAPSIFFTLSDLCEFRNLFHGQAAEIERLRPFEIAARDLDSDLTKIAGERDDQAARIKELEDAHKRSGAKYAKIIDELRSSVYANIPGLDVGKIGPDAKPRSWQITDERKAAIGRAIESVVAADSDSEEQESEDVYTWRVLRDMLEEAE